MLSFGAPASLVAAVASACAQDPAPEVVVVNSGGGDAAARLRTAGFDIPVIEHPGRLLPGGARNAGVNATRGRYIAFLADDHRAEPGWVAARLAAHAQGAAAVGSALVCDRPRHPVALAAHLSLSVRRMPTIAPARALPYGASYERRLFDTYGLFRDDLRAGEDTEFHRRLAPEDRPVWTPSVRTIHRSPGTLWAFFADQRRRGGRTMRAWRAIDGRSTYSVVRASIMKVPLLVTLSWETVPRADRLSLLAAYPLIVLGSLAYAAGALTADYWGDD